MHVMHGMQYVVARPASANGTICMTSVSQFEICFVLVARSLYSRKPILYVGLIRCAFNIGPHGKRMVYLQKVWPRLLGLHHLRTGRINELVQVLLRVDEALGWDWLKDLDADVTLRSIQ